MFKKFKPVTPGTRQLILPSFDELTTQGELKGSSSRRSVRPNKKLSFSKRALEDEII